MHRTFDELIALVCPACGAALPARAGLRVFVCAQCRETSAPASGMSRSGTAREAGLVALPRALAHPRLALPSTGSIVLLPVWIVPVRRADLGARAALLPDAARIPAVGLQRMEVLLRFAAHLTRAAGTCATVALAPEAARELPRSGTELAAEEALRIAECVLLAHADGLEDPGAEPAAIPLGPPALVDLPCQQVGGRLTDLVFGRWAGDALLAECPLADARATLTRALLPSAV